jgi:hypothetical protein
MLVQLEALSNFFKNMGSLGQLVTHINFMDVTALTNQLTLLNRFVMQEIRHENAVNPSG